MNKRRVYAFEASIILRLLELASIASQKDDDILRELALTILADLKSKGWYLPEQSTRLN